MTYPVTKETFVRRSVNDVLSINDKNIPAEFMERLQDVLGLDILLGFATVKLLLDYLKGKADIVDNKVDKSGDTMTGNLIIEAIEPLFKLLITPGGAGSISLFSGIQSLIEIEHDTEEGHILCKVGSFTVGATTDILHFSALVVRVTTSDIEVATIGKGLVLKSPNGTQYRIKVADDGVLSTELK